MIRGSISIAGYVMVVVLLASCRGEPNAGPFAKRFDICNVGKGTETIFLTVTLSHADGDETFEAQFLGKDHLISCHLRNTVTGEEYKVSLLPKQIATLNRAIRRSLSGESTSQVLKDKLLWAEWDEGGRTVYDIPVDIGSDKAVAAVFNRIIELSALPTYHVKPGDTLSSIAADVLGDSSRWKEILELNLELPRDGQYVPQGSDIRVPRKADESATSDPTVDWSKSGVYESDGWKYDYEVTEDNRGRPMGYWGYLLKGGVSVDDRDGSIPFGRKVKTPWGPLYWVNVAQTPSGEHGWMPYERAKVFFAGDNNRLIKENREDFAEARE